MGKIRMAVAVIQFVLHYLGWIGILLGVVAFVFGNTSRGVELVVGGLGCLILKYVIGFIYLAALKLTSKDDAGRPTR